MASDRSGPPATPSALDAILETIRTAVDASLDEAIAEGVALTGYPYTDSSKPIPLAEELTPDQRRLMEAIATRSGLSFHTVRKFRIPDPVQVRRRWLGIDPPGVLEKIVNVPDETGGTRGAMPLWRALQQSLPTASEDPLRGLLPDPVERLRLIVAAAEGNVDPYEISTGAGAESEALGPISPGTVNEETVLWAETTLERLVAAWTEPEREDGSGKGLCLRSASLAEPGWATWELLDCAYKEKVLRQLFAFLLLTGRWTSLDERYDSFVGLTGPYATLLAAAVPEPRRGAALVWAYREEPAWSAFDAGREMLLQFPSSTLADEIAKDLEAPSLRAKMDAGELRRQQAEWNALREKLPRGIARALDPATLVPPALPRGPDRVPARTATALATLDPGERIAEALADVTTFAALAAADRLAVAVSVAGTLGPGFDPLPTLMGERALPGIRHVASGYELVILPGERFVAGLTDEDIRQAEEWFAATPSAASATAFLQQTRASSGPPRTLAAPPIAFGRDIVGGEAERAFAAASGPCGLGRAAALAFAARCGFEIPSEAEWERAARDAEGAAFVYAAAEWWFCGLARPTATRAGIRGLATGEWVSDTWHPTLGGAPATMAAWRSAESALGVVRGSGAGSVRERWDVLRALVARRVCERPAHGSQDYRPHVRFVLRLAGRSRHGLA
jgi:hypothetical protein